MTFGAHAWQDCAPVLLSITPAGGPEITGEQLEMAWSLVPERDRELFHGFCCDNRHDARHTEAMDRITALVELLTYGVPGTQPAPDQPQRNAPGPKRRRPAR